MKHSILTAGRREGGAMTTNHDGDLLTIAEATRLLRVSRVTLHRWLRDGRLPAYHVGPKAVRIRRADLAAVLRPTHGREVSAVTEAQPIPTSLAALRPLSEAEQRRALAALERARQLGARIRVRRDGKPLAESWPIIREAREARSQQQQ
jgi:excisionase family DNA binding protein